MSSINPAKRIAVMTDVHANLPALEAALTAIRAIGCDSIIHTGDAIGIGPFPRETLERLLAEDNLRLVMGNHDWWYVKGLPEMRPEWMSEGEAAHHHWVHNALGPDLRSVVASWPWVIEEHYGHLRVAFAHYGLREDGSGFVDIVRQPTGDTLDKVFERVSADLVFYGHHHPAADHTGRARYVNPGSLGCFCEPVARFSVLDVERDGSYTISQQAASYDWTELFRQLDEREVPLRALIRTAFLGRDPG